MTKPIRALTRQQSGLYHYVGTRCVDGPHARLWGDYTDLSGDCSDLWGNCTYLWGNCSDLWGNCTGLRGDCTDLRGDLDACGLTDEMRVVGVAIADLVEEPEGE